MDYLIIRLVTKTNENYASLESATLDYALKLHEHLDIQESVEANIQRQQDAKSKQRH